MDGPRQLKPPRILLALVAVASLVALRADVRADQPDRAIEARAAAAQACAFLAEAALDLHHPFVARPLADAGLHLLQVARETAARDARWLRLEARLRVVRGQSQFVSEPVIAVGAASRHSARRDFVAALQLARPLLESDPAHRGLRRLTAAAELGLAQDSSNPQHIMARCRSAVTLLQDSAAAQGGADEDWLLASAYQLLGEVQAQLYSDPQAALKTLRAAEPLWQRLKRLHPLGTTKLARWHLSVASVHVMLEQMPQARAHLASVLKLTRATPLYFETLMIRAQALTVFADVSAASPPHREEAVDSLDEAAALYRRLPESLRPWVDEAAVWRRQAGMYLWSGDVAAAQVLLERVVERLEPAASRGGPKQISHRRNVELALGYLALGQLSEPSQPNEARVRFAAACKLFADLEFAASLSQFDPAAVDARCMGLICQTRLAGHFAHTGDLESAAACLQQATRVWLAAADAVETQPAAHPSALANPIAAVPRELLLPLARSLHLLAKIQGELEPQPTTRLFRSAVACYEAASCQGVGEQVDLAVCQLDYAVLLVKHEEISAARDRLAVAAAILSDVVDRDPRGWLPLSTAYGKLAELSLEPSGTPDSSYLDQAVDAARQAVQRDQPSAHRQLANLRLERGLAVLNRRSNVAAARRDLVQAAGAYRLLRSELSSAAGEEDRELLFAELIALRALVKLDWMDGQALENVCRRWQEARQLLELAREESAPWYAEAARLESLRAELIAWSCTGVKHGSLLTLVATIDALPDSAPAGAAADDSPRLPVVSSPAAAAQAYEIANRHYEAADRFGVAIADEWDVLLFNAADYCEYALGDARQALGYFEQELALQDRVSGSPVLRAGNRALICARMGLIESRLLARPDRAAELYRQAVRHLERASSGELESALEREVAIQAELSLGLLAAQLTELSHAAQGHFAAALRMLAQIDEPTERELSFEYWARHGLARQLRRAGDEVQAQPHIKRAAALAAQLGFTESGVGTTERPVVE